MPAPRPVTWWMLVWRQVRHPFIGILAIAAGLSLAINDRLEALFIGAVIVLDIVVGTLQEWGAERSAAALLSLTEVHCLVMRDGVPHRLAARLLVPGDVVLLESGVRIFEWNGTMVHAKTAIADSRWARIGSTNLNVNSWLGNWELDVALEDRGVATTLESHFLEDLERSTEIVLQTYRLSARPRAVDAPPRIVDFSGLFGALDFPAVNIEGATVGGSELRLFQRGNNRDPRNAILRYSLPAVLEALAAGAALGAPAAITFADLGQIEGVPLCFTDAAKTTVRAPPARRSQWSTMSPTRRPWSTASSSSSAA